MKKQKNFKEKGITLVALVVTIIILLILVGVSISTLGGENGIITQAIRTQEESKKAEYREKVNLIIQEEQMNKLSEKSDKLFIEQLAENIQKQEWSKTTTICNNEFQEPESDEQKQIIIVNTNDGYEITIKVDNTKIEAEIISIIKGKAKTYKVTYHANNGTNEKVEVEIREGFSTEIIENTYEKSGYEFVGWSTNKEAEEVKYVQGNKIENIKDNIDLYAIWSTNTATIIFHGNNKTYTQTVQKRTKTPLESYSQTGINYTGYVFKGWAETENGEVKYTDGETIEISQDINLYGVFELDNVTASMSFKVNDVSGANKLTEGTKIVIEATALNSGIQKVELKIGSYIMYSEETEGTTYTKEIGINELINLDKILFYSKNTVTLTVTSISDNTKQVSQSNVQNFTVGSANSLKKLAEIVNGGNSLEGETVLQIANIDLNGSSSNQFAGIGRFGTNSYPFSGTYNGNNFEINNVYINVTEDVTMGLFGYVIGTIKNVTASGTLYKNLSGGRLVGGIVGRAENGTIYNCINKINIVASNDSRIGGICGGGNNVLIENCINEASISGNWQIGGICSGRTIESEIIIKNCINKGDVTGQYRVGGIVGYTDSGNGNIDSTKYKITECVNEGNVTALYMVGGIAGESSVDIQNCYNSGNIASTGYDANEAGPAAFTGGIIGINNGTIKQCINEGNVDADYRVNGGIAGRNLGTINYCANTGDVFGDAAVGGIVGNNRGYISYVYNIADEIEGTSSELGNVGGIIGNQNITADAYTKNAYNRAKVIANVEPGGIVGSLTTGTLSNCFNVGIVTSVNDLGGIYGSTYSTSAITNCGGGTETAMIGWSQETITMYIGNFVKKTNSLPILNITVNGMIF